MKMTLRLAVFWQHATLAVFFKMFKFFKGKVLKFDKRTET